MSGFEGNWVLRVLVNASERGIPPEELLAWSGSFRVVAASDGSLCGEAEGLDIRYQGNVMEGHPQVMALQGDSLIEGRPVVLHMRAYLVPEWLQLRRAGQSRDTFVGSMIAVPPGLSRPGDALSWSLCAVREDMHPSQARGSQLQSRTLS